MKLFVNEKGKLESIEENRFDLVLRVPNNVLSIGDNAFGNSKYLRKVVLPLSVKEVGEKAFSNSLKLKKVILSDNIEELKKTFQEDIVLREVHLPNNLKSIGDDTFYHCLRLKKINIPSSVETIGNHAFYGCFSLKKITLPPKIKVIESYTFDNCHKLKKINIPDGVEKIKDFAFYACLNLKEVTIPDSVETIGMYAFEGCKIKKIKLPNGLKRIEDSTFRGCENLKEITIPSSVQYINQDAFTFCRKINRVNFGNVLQLKLLNTTEFRENVKHYYFNNETKEMIASNKGIKDIEGFKEVRYDEYDDKYGWGKKETLIINSLFSEEELNRCELYEWILGKIVRDLNKDNYSQIIDNIKKENKEFKRLEEIIPYQSYLFYDYFKLANALGVFSSDKIERQKGAEFITNAFNKKIFLYEKFHMEFGEFKLNSYNEEFAEFFMDKQNFNRLMELERQEDRKHEGIIAKIYNSFDDIKEFGRSNRGNQRYRKVTIDMCLKYLEERNGFINVDDSNLDISNEISKYTNKQESFDNAASIRKEYLKKKEEGKLKDHILGVSLLSKIDYIRENIVEEASETLNNLNEVSKESFSYEFLSKYDPRNFTLGKYCSCCAHLEGAGYGIMRASILHPDCQNLVIKDKDGKIIAKSTLYINREQGYGVFNNVEISASINNRRAIYNQYIKAINDFADKYNELNKDKPLKKINVGMGLNDLEGIISEKNEKGNVLKGINFSDYGISGQSYSGDWQNVQYTIWEKDKDVQKIKK